MNVNLGKWIDIANNFSLSRNVSLCCQELHFIRERFHFMQTTFQLLENYQLSYLWDPFSYILLPCNQFLLSKIYFISNESISSLIVATAYKWLVILSDLVLKMHYKTYELFATRLKCLWILGFFWSGFFRNSFLKSIWISERFILHLLVKGKK